MSEPGSTQESPSPPQPGADTGHIPVLVDHCLEHLAPTAGQVMLDCTAGLGGHAAIFASRLGSTGTLVLNDLDSGNLAAAAKRAGATPGGPKIIPLQGNFADAPRRLAELGLSADLVLADLGFASSQMTDAKRGLSFMRDGPLDMRFDAPSFGPGGSSITKVSRPTAAELVNTLPEAELAEIIRDYGEEKAWRRVAEKLVAERKLDPINTTSRLASIVRSVVRSSPTDRIDSATRTFQALRIAVNDELGSLTSLLESIGRAAVAVASAARSGNPTNSGTDSRPAPWLSPGARIGIITFHSLEDRLVKKSFAGLVERSLAEHLTRKPAEASESEVSSNPRSRSAKLRAVRLV